MAASKSSSKISGPEFAFFVQAGPRFSQLLKVSQVLQHHETLDTDNASSSRVSKVSDERYSWTQDVIGPRVLEDSKAQATSSAPSLIARSSKTRSKRVSSGEVVIMWGAMRGEVTLGKSCKTAKQFGGIKSIRVAFLAQSKETISLDQHSQHRE